MIVTKAVKSLTNSFYRKNSCLSRYIIRTFVKNEKEINDPVEINTELQDFYKKLFTDNLSISKQNIVSLLEDLPGKTSYKM